MTRKEAIYVLNKIKPTMHRADGKSTSHILETIALDVAIKALEQEPCDDAVSRQAVLNTLNNMDSALDDDRTVETYKEITCCLLQGLPSVTPTQKWVACSDRLPEENEYVLVCNSQGTMRVCYYHIDDTFYPTEYEDLNETGWYDEVDDALCFEPIAWMPLPEKYKAGSEGDGRR